MYLRILIGLSALAFLSLFNTNVEAACSETRIKRLSNQGRTISAIAKTCDMETDEVSEILDEEEETQQGTAGSSEPSKLPSGAAVGQCGCWGPISPSVRQPHAQCKSGYARPNMCNAMCPAGGYMWQGVCG